MILNKSITNKMVTNNDAAKKRRHRGVDHFHFDWEKVIQEARKFRAVFKCHQDADRIFVYRVLAASQWNLPPRCVWSALEAVHRFGRKVQFGTSTWCCGTNARRRVSTSIEHFGASGFLPIFGRYAQGNARTSTA